MCLLASSPGPSRGLRDCTGRNSPRLAAARTTSSPFTTSVSKLPASLSPHSENQSHYVCTVRSKEVATSGKHTSLSPGGSLDQRLAGGVPKKSTSSRPSSLGRNGSPTGTASPPQTPPHTPETLLRASPQHQPCPKSTTTSACTLTVPLLPQTQPPSHPHPAPHLPHLHPPHPPPRPTPRSSLSHSKSQAVQEPAFAFGALACLPPPPTPYPRPGPAPLSASSNTRRTALQSWVSLRCSAK